MKKTIIALAIASMLIVGSIFTGFPSPAQKEQAAQIKVQKAQLSLNIAENNANVVEQKSAKADALKTYIMESQLTIKDNEIRIAELNLKMINSGKEGDELYGERIGSLEMKNVILRKRIEETKKSQSNWEKIKREFGHEVNDFGNAINDFLADNRK